MPVLPRPPDQLPPLPRVGCGAAILKENRLLLVQRRRAPEAGCWGLPGGKVDAFERVKEAVAREVAEELGIRITPERLLCVVDQIDEPHGEHWVAPVYRVDAFAGEPRLMEPEALSGLGWFALDDLPEPLTEATRQALAALKA
jgi:ADP-ribose pyrophosphatase YjhB (NUDIX family)